MRTIYMVRHCTTASSERGKCISQTNESLSEVGIEQANALKHWAEEIHASHIFVSPLKRSQETAAYVSMERSVEVIETLNELSVGEWEGLSFSEIKARWPIEYEKRGVHIGTTPPPGGESFKDGGVRLEKTILELLGKTKGNLIIVTHSGLLRGWISKIEAVSTDKVFEYCIPCGSITEIEWDDSEFNIKKIGEKPVPFPGPSEITAFYRQCNTPENVQLHCHAVAEKAMDLASGTNANKGLLYAAAMLHDLCRKDGREHPAKAAHKLRKAGYDKLAEIVSVHHDIPSDRMFLQQNKIETEAELLYLADKKIKDTKEIKIVDRFEQSRYKCTDRLAKAAWQKRYDTAMELDARYQISEKSDF